MVLIIMCRAKLLFRELENWRFRGDIQCKHLLRADVYFLIFYASLVSILMLRPMSPEEMK
jgi:hypothetical protein